MMLETSDNIIDNVVINHDFTPADKEADPEEDTRCADTFLAKMDGGCGK
jgi:hypothetical protein